MTYAEHMSQAGGDIQFERYEDAVKHLTAALNILLYMAMLPVWNPSVKFVQERRFECWRRIQSAGRAV